MDWYDVTWHADGTCALTQQGAPVERPALQALLEQIQASGPAPFVAEGRLTLRPPRAHAGEGEEDPHG